MWKRRAALFAAGALLCMGVLRAQQLYDLPAGPMQGKARTACLACHDARLILQQQLNKDRWTKSIDKMIRWGAVVAPEDRQPMIDYFVARFGPRKDEIAEPSFAHAAGVDKIREACLACHDAGLIVQQRLDRRGWTRAVERQVRWGAVVTAANRTAILNYLTLNYGRMRAAGAATPAKKK